VLGTNVPHPETSPARKPHKHPPRQAWTDLIVLHFSQATRLHNTTHIHTMPPPRILPAILRARPRQPLQCLHRFPVFRHASTIPDASKPVVPWKTPTSVWSPENLIPPPKDGEILLERRPNRALPPYVHPFYEPFSNLSFPKPERSANTQ
jgi:hypothetical protein